MSEKREAKIRGVVSRRQKGIVMVIEDVHDPHNAAAILRSCDAFGIQRVCFIFEKQDRYNPRKVGKTSSSSANKWLDFEIYESTKDCFDKLKGEGFEMVVTALSDRAESVYVANLKAEKLALVVGNEHAGVSETAIEMADKVLMIPMRGMVQSFNVSVGAALCMYEVTRQRLENWGKYQLGEASSEALVSDFLDR